MSRPIDPLAWLAPARAVRHWERAALWVCLTAGCITAALAIGWSFWQAGLSKGLQPKASATASAARGTKPQLLCAAEAATAMNNAAGEGAGSGQAGVLLTKHEEEVAERRANAPDSGGALAILDRQGVHPVPQEALLDRQQVHPVLQETLVLPSDGPVSIDAEQIRPGQTIRGEEGKRPMIVVPRGGLRLDAENVRFEEIDFVWDGSDASSGQQAAIVRLQASCVAFQRCSFQSARPDVSLPAAIVWSYPVDPSEAERSLPSGEVSMSHCVLRNVAAGIVCRTHATLAVTLENTLYLGRGPMLALSRYPRVDEGLVIRMTHTTLRASGPLVHCPCGSETRVGTLSIVADGCVFAPSGQTSLLTFSGPQSPEELLKHLTWSGQGSLIPPSTAVASWQEIDGRIHLLDDSALAIAGLVRSEVEFAGPPEANPAASRAVGWQAPLQSPNPPGIVPEHVAGPNR
jgi:hypothetical protein